MSKVYSIVRLFSQTIWRAAVCLAALFIFTVAASAATYVVTTNTDPDNTVSACAANGACTLRQAVNTANAVAGDDVINFAAGLSGQTILLTPALGQISITSSIMIDALAVTNVSVSGGGATRVFNIQPRGSIVVMTGFRITGGNGSGGNGGAIQNTGSLTLNNMVIKANSATNNRGGGIHSSGSGNGLTINNSSILANSASEGGGFYGENNIINLTNVTVSGNTADGEGGGIYTIGGTLNIIGGSVSGNTSNRFSGGGIFAISTSTVTITNASITNNRVNGEDTEGGGMIIIGDGSSTITNSIVSGNTAGSEGGGIYYSSGTHSITGTTFSDNSVGGRVTSNGFFGGGGGLFNVAATVNISNSTVSGNSSGCDCGGGGMTTLNNGTTNLRNVTIANNTASAGPGGGIISFISGRTPGTTNIGNTIVADNTAVGVNKDVNGAVVSEGNNLVRTRGTSTGYVASDLPDGSNPMLEALDNNGGPTLTHELLTGSQAVNAGSNALAVDPSSNAALTNDQRGTGFARIVSTVVDIGAFEVQQATTAATVSISGRVTTQSGNGITNVRLSLTDSQGNVRTATTTAGGYYRFEDVEVGASYLITATGKRFGFSQPSQVLNVNDETTEINFIANSEKRLRVF